MELIEWKISNLEQKLQRLKNQEKDSFKSVSEYWNSIYHKSLKDKCEMIYMLAQGLKYKPYSFRDDLRFTHSQVRKTDKYLDYCYIYKGYGKPVGFISLAEGLFDATQYHHKKMWMWAIENKKEENSFENFTGKLKSDIDYLIEVFNETVKETGAGVYSTYPYLVEFEEPKLKTEKFYLYLEETSKKR